MNTTDLKDFYVNKTLVTFNIWSCACDGTEDVSNLPDSVEVRQFENGVLIGEIIDIFEILTNVIFLGITFCICCCNHLFMIKNKKRSLPRHLHKLRHHTVRTISVLVNLLFWCLYVGEVMIRWTHSQGSNFTFITIVAPFTSLIGTLFALVFYEVIETLAAHQLYLIIPLILWGAQIINCSARFYEITCVYCVSLNSVAASLCLINGFIALCLLIIDATNVILWVAVDRRKQSVDLNPGRGGQFSNRTKNGDLKGHDQRETTHLSSCLRRSHSPAFTPGNSVVLVPSGETFIDDDDEDVGGEAGPEGGRKGKRLRYEHNEAGFLSKCTFWWYVKLIRQGWKRPLEYTDIDRIPEEESSKYHYEKFKKTYLHLKTSTSGELSLWKAFLLCHWQSLLRAGILKFLGDTVNVVGPLAISPIVAFVRSIQEGTWEWKGQIRNEIYFVSWAGFMRDGWILALIALVASLLQSTFSQASTHILATAGIRLQSALQALVYDKSLKMSVSPSKRQLEKGDKIPGGKSQSLDAARVINLTWDDTENILSFLMHCHYLWAIPFKVTGLVALLWLQLGNSAVLAALIIISLLVPLQYFVAKSIAGANSLIVDATDKRLGKTHEVMTLIRTVKALALETLFIERVTEARKEELRHLLKAALLRATMTFLTQASGILMIMLAFGIFSYLEDQAPDEGVVFSSLALFSQLTVPLFLLPLLVAHSIKAKRSTSRLQIFLSEPEVSPKSIVHQDQGIADSNPHERNKSIIVKVEKADFSYDHTGEDVVLRNITSSIARGKLTMIVGGVGSGKTSFLLSLLGELNQTCGTMKWERSGSVAFVSQTPWLLNCTLRENILMGRPLQSRKYKRILGVCALQPDIDILPDGDDTEIGEKGINLSGGQRQRVALARALYSDLPVVMMDCPFSALDATVAQQVFRLVTEEHLRKGLSSTLVITTQHNRLCTFADKIIYLEDKTIKYDCSPEELSHRDPGLWEQWTSSFGVGECVTLDAADGEGSSLWKERNHLHRHLTRISRLTRKKTREKVSTDEDFSDSLRSPVRRHMSLLRTSPLQILLPSSEIEDQDGAYSSRKRLRPPSMSVFRTASSSSIFERPASDENSPFDRRFARSLPPRPSHSRTNSRESNIDGGQDETLMDREESVLRDLFPHTSSRNRETQTKPTRGWWNNRFLSFLSWKTDRLPEDGEGSEEGEEEEESSDEDNTSGVFKTLNNEEERQRGRISRWNYVAYLKACGWTSSTFFFIFLLLNQGLLITLDVWLGHWSKMCAKGNCGPSEESNCSTDSLIDYTLSFDAELSNQTDWQAINGTDCSEVTREISSYLVIFGILSCLAVLSGLLTICLAQVAAHRGRMTLHQHMLTAVVNTRGRFFDVTAIGRILNRFSSDVSLIDKELGWSLMHCLYFALLCSSAIFVNAVISPIFIVVSVPICLVYYFLQHVFRCSSRELKRLESMSRSPIMSLITETAEFPCVVRAYGIQTRFFSCYFRRLDSHLSSYILLHTGTRWLGIGLDYMGSVVVFLSTIACLVGSTTGVGDLLSPLTVGLAIKYTLVIPVYLTWLVRFFCDTEMCLNAVERVRQYGRLLPEADWTNPPTNKGVCCTKKKCQCQDTLRRSMTSVMRTIPSDNGPPGISVTSPLDHLVFEDVNLFYDMNGEAVISDVSFSIPAGQKVGVCGRTGSGKSSLLMGILRMTERQEGRILINGLDVQRVRLSLLRKGISVVPQEVNIFRDSVRFNMDPEKKYSDDALWKALDLVQLKDFVTDLPQKLDTHLSSGSFTLSAGQTQLLILSRVLLEKRALVLLDEFTCSLDAQVESYLMTMLKEELPHSTIIFVAHSIVSLMNCHRVLSIDEGRLVEDGAPSELCQRSQGVFISLLRSANQHKSGDNQEDKNT